MPTNDSKTESQFFGLIGGMKSGMVSGFGYRCLNVKRRGESVAVQNQDGEQLGGRLLLKSASLLEVRDWLEAKADYYGDNQ